MERRKYLWVQVRRMNVFSLSISNVSSINISQYVNATTSATSANSDTLQWGELYGFPRSDGPEAHYEPFQKIRSDQLDLGKGSSGFYLEEPHPRSNTHALEDDYQTRFNPGSDAPNTLPENNVRTTMSMSQGDGSVFLQSNWFRNGLFTPSQIQESYSQATVSRPNADTRHLYSQMNGNTYEVNKIPKPRDSSAGAFAAALPHRVALSMARNLSGTITSFPTAFGRMGGACDIEISQERKHCLKCGADNRTRPPERVTFAESVGFLRLLQFIFSLPALTSGLCCVQPRQAHAQTSPVSKSGITWQSTINQNTN